MSFRLLHYSDPHFGAANPLVAKGAITMARDLAPDFTLVSGDFAMRGRRWEFRAAREWLDELPRPRLVIPGNHDVPALNQPFDRFFAPFRRYRKLIHEEEEPSAELGDLGHLASANSTTPFGLHLDWSLGFLGPLQASRLKAEFREIEAKKLRLLTIHHPLLASGEKERALVAPMPLVKGLLAEARVDLVLTGHFHQSRTGLFLPGGTGSRPLVVSQSPSVCSTRLKGEPNGFHLIELEKSALKIDLYRWRGREFVVEKRDCFRLGSGGWASSEG